MVHQLSLAFKIYGFRFVVQSFKVSNQLIPGLGPIPPDSEPSPYDVSHGVVVGAKKSNIRPIGFRATASYRDYVMDVQDPPGTAVPTDQVLW